MSVKAPTTASAMESQSQITKNLHSTRRPVRLRQGRMTKYPMTKEARMTNDEGKLYGIGRPDHNAIVIRASSIIHHWVLRHSSLAFMSVTQ
jgi:hypothetical protein